MSERGELISLLCLTAVCLGLFIIPGVSDRWRFSSADQAMDAARELRDRLRDGDRFALVDLANELQNGDYANFYYETCHKAFERLPDTRDTDCAEYGNWIQEHLELFVFDKKSRVFSVPENGE
jgi:hypothetical protein